MLAGIAVLSSGSRQRTWLQRGGRQTVLAERLVAIAVALADAEADERELEHVGRHIERDGERRVEARREAVVADGLRAATRRVRRLDARRIDGDLDPGIERRGLAIVARSLARELLG